MISFVTAWFVCHVYVQATFLLPSSRALSWGSASLVATIIDEFPGPVGVELILKEMTTALLN